MGIITIGIGMMSHILMMIIIIGMMIGGFMMMTTVIMMMTIIIMMMIGIGTMIFIIITMMIIITKAAFITDVLAQGIMPHALPLLGWSINQLRKVIQWILILLEDPLHISMEQRTLDYGEVRMNMFLKVIPSMLWK